MSVWSELITGIIFVAGGYWIIKTVYQWNYFRKSIYKELYSGYIEYAFRKKNITRLSKSYYLDNELGHHRIVYQIVQSKTSKVPEAYVILILSTGMYLLNIKNQNGKVVLKKHGDMKQIYISQDKKDKGQTKELLLKNPLDESMFFEKRMRQRMGNIDSLMTSMVVFPDKTEVVFEGTNDSGIQVINKKELIGEIKKGMDKASVKISDDKIERIFHHLADESIEIEKNM